VIVSAEEDKKIILQTLAFGAVGFITKSSSKETIANALVSVFEGDVYLPPDIIRNGHAQNNPPPAATSQTEQRNDNLSSLTRRQLMVLKCMTKGLANKQIADSLNISETTVKSHVSSILKKLGVYNRVQAVVGCSDINFNHYLKR
jgi:DNA-binding NarL/FixJ family response regulator